MSHDKFKAIGIIGFMEEKILNNRSIA